MSKKDHLDKLEATSVHILREAYREFSSLVMLIVLLKIKMEIEAKISLPPHKNNSLKVENYYRFRSSII